MVKKTTRKRSVVAILVIAACAAMTAVAITQAEWEADHSLIPVPSESSVFYVVSPTAYAGAQTVDAVMSGYDTTSAERIYDFQFGTDLKTYICGATLIIR